MSRRLAAAAIACMPLLMAQAPVPPPLPALTSNYVQALIGYGGFAAGAVTCGLRPADWGDSIHQQLVNVMSTHAGSPVPDLTPDGRFVSTVHVPSPQEKTAALRSLQRHEEDGRREASQPYAKAGQPSSYCTIVQNMALKELDDYQDGTASLWPSM